MLNRKFFIITASILILLSTFMLSKEQTIKIGFAGTLSEHWSQLSIESRDGFLLALENINETGGILGKKIEVVFYDDLYDPEHAKTLVDKFLEDNVEIIAGFHSSKMKESVDYISEINGDILFVSPTMNSHTLKNLDDNLIMVMSSADTQIPIMIKKLKTNNIKTILILYDPSNKAYSLPFTQSLEIYARDEDIKFFPSLEFDLENGDRNLFIKYVKKHNPDGIYFVYNAIDTTELTQILRNNDISSSFFASSWSDKSTLLKNGGSSIEGMYITGFYNKFNNSEKYIEFKELFYNQYGYKPTVSNVYGYNTLLLISQAIEDAGTHTSMKVKESIIEKGVFEGLQGDYEINKYGDANGNVYLYKIHNGKFQPTE